MLGNWSSHGFILHWSRDWIRTNDLLGMSQTSYQLRYSAMKGLTTRAANPQLWPAPSLNWPGRRLPFRRLSFLPYRTPRHLITTLCFEGNLGEFFTIFLGDEPSHPTLQQDYFFFGMRNLKTHLTKTEPISVLVRSCCPVFSALTVGACSWSDLNRRPTN